MEFHDVDTGPMPCAGDVGLLDHAHRIPLERNQRSLQESIVVGGNYKPHRQHQQEVMRQSRQHRLTAIIERLTHNVSQRLSAELLAKPLCDVEVIRAVGQLDA